MDLSKKVLLLTTTVFTLAVAFAVPSRAVFYDLGKNGENKTNIAWESRATIETIIGTSNQVEGYAFFDEKDSTHEVFIKIPVVSIHTGIEKRDRHLRGPDWLDAKRNPFIEFQSTRIVPVKDKAGTYKIQGLMTIHGVTRRVSVTGTAERHPALKGMEKYGYVGEIIHLKTRFPIRLADYRIRVPQELLGLKVAPEVTVTFDVFGFTNNKPNRLPPARRNKPAPPVNEPSKNR